MSDVFISYAREDKEFVQKLNQSLAEYERKAWVDWEGIEPTEEWLGKIYRAIEASDAFAFVISPDSVVSSICRKEIEHAVKHHKRLVPIVRREVDIEMIPESLQAINWLFLRDTDNFHSNVESLVRIVNTDLDWVRAHTRLLVRANEWETKGYDKSYLLRGKDLQGAEHWQAMAADKEPKPTALQLQYILSAGRAEKARQRNILAAVSLGLAIVVVVGVLAVLQWREADIQRRRVEEQRNAAVAAEAKATERFNDGRQFARTVIFDLHKEIVNLSGSTAAVQILAEASLSYLKGLSKHAEGDSSLLGDIASTYVKVGDIQGGVDANFGNMTAALQCYRESLRIHRSLIEAAPTNLQALHDLSISYDRIGSACVRSRQWGEAMHNYREGLVISKRLEVERPNDPSVLRDLAVSYENIGDVLVQTGELDTAFQYYCRARVIRERLDDMKPADTRFLREWAVNCNKIGDVLSRRKDADGAIKSYQSGLGIMRSLADRHPQNPQIQRDLSATYTRIGDAQAAMGDMSSSLASYRDAMRIADRLLRENADNVQAQWDWVISCNKIGDIQIRTGDLSGAAQNYQKALDIAVDSAQRHPDDVRAQRDLSISYNKIGDVCVRRDDVHNALASYRRGLDIRARLAATNSDDVQSLRDLLVSYNKIADTLAKAGDIKEALASYREGLRIAERIVREHPGDTVALLEVGRSYGHVAWCQLLLRQYGEAQTSARQGLHVDPTRLRLSAIVAHGQLFLGQYGDASATYLANKDTRIGDGQTFVQLVLDDFSELRKRGVVHPDMKKIEMLFLEKSQFQPLVTHTQPVPTTKRSTQ